jgi:uncharacterized protein (DUF924 family)
MQHAEDLAMQERQLAAFRALLREATPELRPALESSVEFALLHRDLIARFGRFPHRNRALGRASTPDEEKFLVEGSSSFGQ